MHDQRVHGSSRTVTNVWRPRILTRSFSEPQVQVVDPDAAFERACALLEAGRKYRGSQDVLLLIDGRSGSGKTSFTQRLAVPFPEAHVIHLDDLYPNWNGLADGVARGQQLVRQWAKGDEATYLPTQWPGMASRTLITIPFDRQLIVEGVGAAACQPPASSGVWCDAYFLEVDIETRKSRALARDGETFAPHWDAWASQEDKLRKIYPFDSRNLTVVREPRSNESA